MYRSECTRYQSYSTDTGGAVHIESGLELLFFLRSQCICGDKDNWLQSEFPIRLLFLFPGIFSYAPKRYGQSLPCQLSVTITFYAQNNKSEFITTGLTKINLIDIFPEHNKLAYCALVAQLAEHIHGKDKVISSILIEGYVFT